jgi:hypothetical protein
MAFMLVLSPNRADRVFADDRGHFVLKLLIAGVPPHKARRCNMRGSDAIVVA